MPEFNPNVTAAINRMDSMIEEDENDNYYESEPQHWMAPEIIPDTYSGQHEVKFNVNAKDTLKANTKMKRTAMLGKQVVGTTGMALTHATNFSGGALMGQAGWAALFSGAALSAGPISLLIASAALTIADSTKNAVSAYKTNQHIKNLQALQSKGAKGHFCQGQSNHHDHIFDTILPYIIAKKQKKKIRKMGSAVPVIGSAIEQTRAKSKALYKLAKHGGIGRNRKLHAEYLARHHCHRTCYLTTDIIAELFSISFEEALATRDCNHIELAAVLSLKFKSV